MQVGSTVFAQNRRIGGNDMYKHHQDTIDNITKKMKERNDVLALLIGGSIAHGFATEDSDVDIMIVISNEDYEKRYRENILTYFERESCTYEKGYVDGKYISLDFLDKVRKFGSDPARFAFKDAFLSFSKMEGLDGLLKDIAQFPKDQKADRMKRFIAQVHAWNWYYSEGANKNNPYLMTQAVTNLVLFGGRAILAYNELLYPYHKWFLKVLEGAGKKPAGLMDRIETILREKSPEAVEGFVQAVLGFTDWGIEGTDWPRYFMQDSELGWMVGNCFVGDI